jgi:hypothetical protein
MAVKNAYAIISISRQLTKASESIGSLAMGIQDVEQGIADISGVYEDLLLSEVEHAQILTLELTKLLTSDDGAPNTDEGDGSVFSQGDLTHTKAGPDSAEEDE